MDINGREHIVCREQQGISDWRCSADHYRYSDYLRDAILCLCNTLCSSFSSAIK
jgi:hypothetical protein